MVIEERARRLRECIAEAQLCVKELRAVGCKVDFNSEEVSSKNRQAAYNHSLTYFYVTMPFDLTVKVTMTREL